MEFRLLSRTEATIPFMVLREQGPHLQPANHGRAWERVFSLGRTININLNGVGHMGEVRVVTVTASSFQTDIIHR